VPCHRVVGAGGTLGGYGGQSAGAPIAEKARLLRAEGVRLSAGGMIPADRVLRDTPATRRLLRGD
jgi:alkylated DNA nucleotide flippase Atl1